MNGAPSSRAYVPAWDLPTRLFHWTLVALIVCLTLGMTTISVSTNFNRVSK